MARVFDFTAFEELYPEWEARFKFGEGVGDFGFLPGAPTCSYGTTDMLISRAIIGRLDLAEAEKDAWAATINRFQDQRGWYHRSHTLHYREHTTAYAIAALALIDRVPNHSLAWAPSIMKDTKHRERWIRSINWSLIWPGSHAIAGIPAALAMTGGGSGEFFSWYLDWLDSEVDPGSGFWCRGLAHRLGLLGAPGMHEMGGAFHMYFLYERFGRAWKFPERVVDSCLRLQHENGLWDGDETYCVDLDGIYSLTRSSRNAGGYRAQEIRSACERYLRTAEQSLNDRDFLFRHYKDSHRLPGALGAIAECQLFFPDLVTTRRPWFQSLDKACWI